MQLRKAHILNFRSIQDITLTFDPRCRVLVGINESGKTNILQALSFLDSARKPAPTDVRIALPDEEPDAPSEVQFIFSLSADDLKQFSTRLKRHIFNYSPTQNLLHTKKSSLNLDAYVASKSEAVYWTNIRTGTKASSHWTTPGSPQLCDNWYVATAACPPDFVVGYSENEQFFATEFDLFSKDDLADKPAEFFRPATLKDFERLSNTEFKSIVDPQIPNCLYWSYNDNQLLPAQISLAAFSSQPSICEPLAQMFALADISDIEDAISDAQRKPHGIRNLLNRVAIRSTDHIRSVWKDYRGVTIALEPNGPNIDASVRDEHTQFEFLHRSDGFKRFVTFLLLVSAKAETSELTNTLYLHDEPDLSLHPSGCRHLRDELIRISESNYVVFSTHSIHMIDRDRINRHLIVEKRSETTTADEANYSNVVDEEVLYNALGYSVFDSLKPMNIIFEGWRDKHLYDTALSANTQRARRLKRVLTEIGRCHVEGVKDIRRITPLLELANRRWIVLSDSDGPAVEAQRSYDGTGQWLRYDECGCTGIVTGEDFICAAAFGPIVDEIRTEHSSLPSLDQAALSSGRPKIAVIQEWLAKGGIGKEASKQLVSRIKSAVFEGLSASQIGDHYYEFLDTLMPKLAVPQQESQKRTQRGKKK